MKKVLLIIKPYLKWFIWGLILFYLINTLANNWLKIKVITLTKQDYFWLISSFFVTLTAHLWAGIVWFFLLRKTFKQKVKFLVIIKIYLITNMAKYLPGNIWHFYGRINGIYQKGCDLGIASISVLLEPLLMASGAFLITIISHSFGLISGTDNLYLLGLELIIFLIILSSFHPHIINPIIQKLSQIKLKNQEQETSVKKNYLTHYPLLPLIGELIFVILRSMGFLLMLMALTPMNLNQISPLVSSFSFAWLLGLIIPGAPGGLGIFEVTMITLLDQQFPQEILLVSVAIYRLISILTEITGAGLTYLPNFPQNQIKL